MLFRYVTIVEEHHAGLLFHNGKLERTLTPGRHVFWGRNYQVDTFDLRDTTFMVTGQEIPAVDGIHVRAGARVTFRIVDPVMANARSSWVQSELYAEAHEVLRNVISAEPHETVVARRAELSAAFRDALEPAATDMGLDIVRATIIDLTLAGEVRKAFAGVVVAQLEARATLERSRGETAALRNLANAARMMDDNPNLAKLRWMQALERASVTVATTSPD